MKTENIKYVCGVGIICLFLPILMCVTSITSIHNFNNWAMWGNWIGGVASCVAAILMWQIFVKQDERISKNQFETIFFDKLRTFREIRADAIEKEFEQFVDEYKKHFVLNVQIEKLEVAKIKAIMILFMDIHEKGKSFLSCFRYIERIADYIDMEEQLDKVCKEKYAKHFIALLSPNEVVLIKLRMFVGKYEALRNTTLGKLLMTDATTSETRSLNAIMQILSLKLDISPSDISEKANEINFGDVEYAKMEFLDAYKYFFEQ